jgi:ATP-dependent Lon protease
MNDITPDPREISAEALGRDAAPANGAQPQAKATLRPLPDDAVIILPVRNVVLFPGLVVPLQIGRER